MSAIGSLVFCTDCGNLLDPTTGNSKHIFICACCGAENQDVAPKTITTRSKPSALPSELRQKLSNIQTVEAGDLENQPVINRPCDKCGREEVMFSAVQSRSADEGSTIYYRCVCGHKWTENN